MTRGKFIEKALQLADWYHCGQVGFDHYVEGLANLLWDYEMEIKADAKGNSNND